MNESTEAIARQTRDIGKNIWTIKSDPRLIFDVSSEELDKYGMTCLENRNDWKNVYFDV